MNAPCRGANTEGGPPMLNKRCRCCGAHWNSLTSFIDDLSLIPAGQLDDPNPAYSLSAFVHECGEVLYIEQKRLDAHMLRRRLQQVARRQVEESADLQVRAA
jgi:hypothetical protein